MRKIPIVLRHIYNKIVIIIGFGIFYFEDSRQLLTFFRNLTFFNPNGFFGLFEQTSVSNHLILIIVSVVCTFPLLSLVRKLTEKWEWTAPVVSAAGTVLTVALLITSSILLVDATTNPFLYYRF